MAPIYAATMNPRVIQAILNAGSALVLAACGGQQASGPTAPDGVARGDGGTDVAGDVDDNDGGGAVAGEMTAPVERAYVQGIALDAAPALVAWLEQLGDRVVKLPVLVDYDGVNYANAQVVGVGLTIALDDGALGVGLADRVRIAGNSSGQAWLPTVAIWLEGKWQAGRLRIDRAGQAMAPSELSDASHAFVEAQP